MKHYRKPKKGILRSASIPGRMLNLVLFIAITLLIHFIFRWWAYDLNYHILGKQIITIDFLNRMGSLVFANVVWLVNDVFNIGANIQGIIIYMPDGGGVAVDGACSGFKQILQLAILFLLVPGPWMHKAWFIPAGILIMHITNVVRVFGLCMVMWVNPDHFDLFHDYVFRPLFYLVIFGLWLLWTEKLRTRT